MRLRATARRICSQKMCPDARKRDASGEASSADAVARVSSRVTCALGALAQTSCDPDFLRESVGGGDPLRVYPQFLDDPEDRPDVRDAGESDFGQPELDPDCRRAALSAGSAKIEATTAMVVTSGIRDRAGQAPEGGRVR